MRKVVLSIVFLFSFIASFSQGLDVNAIKIKQNYNSAYENTIKKYALIKWKDDFEMVVYEINKQSDALINIVETFKSKNTSILYKAIIKWSETNKSESNHNIWKQISNIDLETLLRFHVDWTMVEYEYNNQVKASTAF